MQKVMMIAVAILLSVRMFAHSTTLPAKTKKAHATENVVDAKSVHKPGKAALKKQGDKKLHAHGKHAAGKKAKSITKK